MSKHSVRSGPVLKVKVWVAIVISVVISAEVGIALALVVYAAGIRGIHG